MAPKILVMGELFWVSEQELMDFFGSAAEIVYMESQTREEFFTDLAEGGRYSDIVGIYHEHSSHTRVGQPDKDVINALPPSCKWLAHKGAGYDLVDVHAAKARGISVSNTPGAVDEATATTAVYLLISTMRRFSQGERLIQQGAFSPIPEIESKAFDLSGKTIGVLGLGGIGTSFVNYIRPFGMKMLYHNRSPSSSAAPDLTYVPKLEDMLSQINVLMVSCPLNANTRGIIGEKAIRAMKKGSIIVNIARGPIIDEEAMIKALEDGHLGAVGLDVFTNEPEVDQRLLAMPQATVLPHIGTENQDARRKMEMVALENLKQFLLSGNGPNLVPECR